MCHAKLFVYFSLAVLAVTGLEERNLDENCPTLTEKKYLMIDVDAGCDDGVALLNILGAEELFQNVHLRLITLVNGNTNVDNVGRNVLKILKTVNRLDIPVYKGARHSLTRTPKIDDFFGKDGFGDFHFPNPPPEDLIKKKPAANALIDEANLCPGELTLLCLGPLTNIALAARLDSAFFSKLKEIYVLGGSDSGVGNIRPGVEFNFDVDPEAAYIVFKEAEKHRKIINLLTWETSSMRSLVKMKWRTEVLGALNSPQIKLLNKAEKPTLVGENWISSDSLLSAAVIDSEIVESSDVYSATVETCGECSRGALFTDYSHSTNSTANVRILKKINTDKFKEMLLQNLNSSGGPRNGSPRLRTLLLN